MNNPLKYYDNNIIGVKILLESMVENKINKIVFSSSASVYGDSKKLPLKEDDITNPQNPYGETKLAIEQMLKWCEKAYGIKHISLRYFNAAGAHISGVIGEAHSPESHLIPLVLKTALGQKDFIPIFGNDYETKDKTCIRDYIHVSDLAQAHILAIEYLNKYNKSNIFNLGNGIRFSNLQIIETAREITQKSIPIKFEERRKGDPAMLISSSDKAKKLLNWKPEFTKLEDIISTAWNWHKNHPNGY